jgi:L-2,4-diaminobutyrate transaminase
MSERDYSKQLAADLDQLIRSEGPETVGAFIAEPVMGAGGVYTPPEGYFQEIQAVLDEHDVLMIADEVICGFGRLGAWFGSDLYGIRPDIMTMAKGLTSGYLPMSASVVGDKVWQVIIDHSREIGPFGHGYTYGAHPVAAAAAMANLDIIEGEDLVGNAKRVGAHLLRRLHETFDAHPLVGHVRGEGLMAAIELVADRGRKEAFASTVKAGARLQKAALAEGVLARALPGGDIIAVTPPLSITADEVDQITERLGRALDRTAVQMREEGVWRG